MAEIVGGNREQTMIMLRNSLFALAATAIFVLVPAAGYAAGDSRPGGASPPVTFEDIPGTNLKRVKLSEKAAERLGIELGKVYETEIIRTQIVGGRIVLPVEEQPEPRASGDGFGGFAIAVAQTTEPKVQEVVAQTAPPEIIEAWVLITLAPEEWERTEKSLPARIMRLQTREGDELLAMPSGLPPYKDQKRTLLTAYYVIPGENNGLSLHERVRVELHLTGTDRKRKVVPYDAVYYDNNGKAWVYASPAPFVYERMPIDIDRIDGNLAILNEGPPLGTDVVTVGAALLYGAEVIYKR